MTAEATVTVHRSNPSISSVAVQTQEIKRETKKMAYSGYVLVERGFGGKLASGLIVPASVKSEVWSFVQDVGPECRHGIQPGDWVCYVQGTDAATDGPNGGKLFYVAENNVCGIETHDGRRLKHVGREATVFLSQSAAQEALK